MMKNISKEPVSPKNRFWLVGLGILGILLLLIGGYGGLYGERESDSISKTSENVPDADAFCRELEAKIVAICSRVSGVGEVNVAVSLDGGYQTIFVSNSYISDDAVRQETVLLGSGSSEEAIAVGYRCPEIAGVGIVCDGGGETGIRAELISLVSAAFNIPSHKIYVSGT